MIDIERSICYAQMRLLQGILNILTVSFITIGVETIRVFKARNCNEKQCQVTNNNILVYY